MWQQKETLTIEESYRVAFDIYQNLLMNNGKIEDDDFIDLFEAPEVQKIIRNIIEPKANVRIIKTHDEKTLILVPNPDNGYLTYTNDELKKSMGLNGNRELYLAYFLILVLISQFYNNRDTSLVKRQFLSVDDLLRLFNLHMEELSKIDSDFVGTLSEEYELDFVGMIDAWDRQTLYKEGTKQVVRTKDNQYGFVLRVLNFFHKEELIYFLQEREVRIADKMDQIIQHYYNNPARKEQILNLLDKGFRRFQEEE